MARIIVDEKVCKGCGMCVYACPKKLIALAKDRINATVHHTAEMLEAVKCTGCCSCAIMCPDTAITVER